MACDNSSKPEDNGGYTPEVALGDLPPVPRVATQFKVVNNTSSTINVWPRGFSNSDPDDVLSSYYRSSTGSGVIKSNSEGSFVLVWDAKGHVLSTTDPALVNNPNFCPSNLELASTVKKNFRPYVCSFLLSIQIDDATYYLAGWPQSMGVPSGVDGSKIVKYGVGYSNNKEILLHEQYGSAYLPYIICYDEGGSTVERDFGEHQGFIMGKAVITIDAPDKIEYRTESLEARSWGDYNEEWGW